MVMSSPVAPAMQAVQTLRVEMKKRIGKPDGTLNRLMLSQLDVIETTLNQIEPLGSMINMINQQAEIAVSGFRALARVQALLPETNGAAGDDGSSETKGN